VRDRALARAVVEAYREAGVREARPQAFVFLEVPPHLVDVNEHPAKTEVKFADPRVAFAAVAGAVRGALSEATRPGPAQPQRDRLDADGRASRVAEAVAAYASRPQESPGDPRGPSSGAATTADLPAASALFPAGPPSVLGQHRNTYVVASDGEELILLDQHTAHERVRFEAILARLEAHDAESQLLLAPVVTALEPRLLPVLEEHALALRGLGFDAEPFGGGSVRLRALPPLLAGRDPGAALQALLRDLLEREASQWIVEDGRSRVAATLACHSAVRAGQPLNPETMARIVRELARTRHPALCPHGRPTSVRVPREDVSRWFGRAGWVRR
jgi:DNA mismatch repair protein MutL